MDSDTRDDKDGKPVWQRSENDRQIDADAYHIWTPRPLIRSVYWRPEEEPPREAVSGSYELFVDQRAFTSMHEHVWGAGADESPFGYLVGDLCEDPTANRRFVIVTQVVPARFPFQEAQPEQISGEASVALKLEADRKRGVLVGWYHAHSAGEPILTAADVSTHERLFPDPWQVAILFVSDPDRPAGATFRRTPEGLDGELPLPFYEMVTNESLLAKGVRRSRIDWENVSTLDKVRAEPPPRPEARPSTHAEPPAPPPQVPAGPDPEPDRKVEPEPAVEFETEPLSTAETEQVAEEASRESPPDGLEDDLDFDALIAEVESAGLEVEEPAPEPDTEEAVEEDTAGESEIEDALDALTEVEDDLASADAAADPSTDESLTLEGAPEEDPALAEEAPPQEPSAQAVAESMQEAAAGPGVDEPQPHAPPAEVGEPMVEELSPREEPVEVATPAVEPGEETESAAGGRRRWALPVLGLLIAIAVIAVLIRGLGSGVDSDSAATPDRTEATPAVQDRERPDPEAPTEAIVSDPAAGAALAEGETDTPSAAESGQPVPAGQGSGDGAVADPDSAIAGVADPSAVPTPAPVSIETLRDLSDTVVESISTFYGRSGAFDRGEIECPDLQASFVEVMDSWIDYSTRGRADWQGRMPPDVEERDERLYLGVQDVERLFEGSSCPRP
ncbi:MAG: hypothetical protein M8863_04720 [marine benthic group bacterium]|nr:hypothetical protein [Gemmatimonadota bacterium]